MTRPQTTGLIPPQRRTGSRVVRPLPSISGRPGRGAPRPPASWMASRVARTSATMGDVSLRQAVALLALLALAVLVQPTVVGVLELPLGGPALPAIAVACVALVVGPSAGGVAGFATGLVADLYSDHVIGRLAMVLCLVGYLVGLLRLEARRSVVVPIAAVAGAGVASALLFAGTGVLVDDSRAGGATLATSVLSALVYAVVLTPFLFPLVARIARPRPRTEDEQ